MSQRSAARLAGLLWVLSVVLVAASLWLRAGLGGGLVEMGRDWSLATATIALSSSTVGALIVSRRSGNLVGWVFCISGVSTPLAGASRYYATRAFAEPGVLPGGEWAVWLFAWLLEVNFWAFVALVLLFPHGRVSTARARTGLVLAIAAGLLGALTAALSPFDATPGFPFPTVSNPLAILPADVAKTLRLAYGACLVAGPLAALAVTVLRFRRSEGVERQQYKVFAFGALCLAGTFAVALVDVALLGFAAIVFLPALPVATGVAVLRYGLYDIDRLLNRTLVYTLLTVTLAGVYVAAVVALQALLRPLAGDSQLAVAGSTLLVAALFGPARRWLQTGVDRRFNRARYDAAQTVEAFTTRLRDQVDLHDLTGQLLKAVQQTVQPAKSSLWLAPSRREPQR